MDTRRLEAFLAVVDAGSFTAAADELGVTQPAVSQAVAALERELGGPLFHRLGRGVRLTDAGEALCVPARAALRDVDEARRAVAGVRDVVSGRLELACLPTLAADPLAPLLGAFRARHGAVTVRLLDPEDTKDALELVRSGRCELALVAEAPPTPGLHATPMGSQSFRAVLPPGTPSAATLRVAALAEMPMVAPPVGSSSRDVLDAVLAMTGNVATVVVESAQREALLPLVAAGAGAALVPAALAESAKRLGCAVAELDPPVGRVVTLVRRDAPLSPAGEAFCALALGHGQRPVDPS